jgi:hypothetical protein
MGEEPIDAKLPSPTAGRDLYAFTVSMSGCGGKRAQGKAQRDHGLRRGVCGYGTSVDPDTDLEAAGIEHLLNSGENTRR